MWWNRRTQVHAHHITHTHRTHANTEYSEESRLSKDETDLFFHTSACIQRLCRKRRGVARSPDPKSVFGNVKCHRFLMLSYISLHGLFPKTMNEGRIMGEAWFDGNSWIIKRVKGQTLSMYPDQKLCSSSSTTEMLVNVCTVALFRLSTRGHWGQVTVPHLV